MLNMYSSFNIPRSEDFEIQDGKVFTCPALDYSLLGQSRYVPPISARENKQKYTPTAIVLSNREIQGKDPGSSDAAGLPLLEVGLDT